MSGWVPVALLPLLFLGGCSTVSSFQTARTLAPGEVSLGLAVTDMTSEGKGVVEGVPVRWELESAPTAELLLRYGFFPRFDAGLKVYLPITGVAWTVDGKYQYYDGEEVDAAVVLGFGSSRANFMFDVTTADGTEEVTDFMDYFAALPFTFRISDSATVTLAPRYLDRAFSSVLSEEREKMVGGSLTFSLGRRFQIRPELAWFTGDEDTEISFFGVGVVWGEE